MSDPLGRHTSTCLECEGRGWIPVFTLVTGNNGTVAKEECPYCKGKGYTVEDLDTEYGCGEAPHPKCNGAEGCDTCEEADSEKKEV